MFCGLFVFFSDARTYLRKLREDQIRDAAMVVQIWEEVLMNYAYNLGDECKSSNATSLTSKRYPPPPLLLLPFFLFTVN